MCQYFESLRLYSEYICGVTMRHFSALCVDVKRTLVEGCYSHMHACHRRKSTIIKCYFSKDIIALNVPTGFEPANCGSQSHCANNAPTGTITTITL